MTEYPPEKRGAEIIQTGEELKERDCLSLIQILLVTVALAQGWARAELNDTTRMGVQREKNDAKDFPLGNQTGPLLLQSKGQIS